MHNTGTWNSDLACIFFLCLLAPICWYFLVAALEVHASTAVAPQRPKKRKVAKRVTRSSHGLGSKSQKRWIHPALKSILPKEQRRDIKPPNKVASQPKTKPKPKAKPKPKEKASPQKSLTSSIFQNEAVSALSGLGFKKSDASKIVKDVSSKKEYDSTESLIKACFMCI